MEILIGILVGLLLTGSSLWFGMRLGKSMALQSFRELAKRPISGQTVNVRGIGDVLITGLGSDDLNDDGQITEDEELLFYITQADLKGRQLSELTDSEVELLETSVPVQQFVLQCDFVRAQFLVD